MKLGLQIPNYIAWGAIAAVAVAALYFYANRTLYYPAKYPEGHWDEQQKLGATDVWLETQDGVRLHAWFIRRDGARFVTLFFHGNAGNLSHRAPHIREILAAGSSVFIPDYRGYGKSSGWPTEHGLCLDGETAYQYLAGTAGYRSEQIVVHGESLGTAVAVDVAARHACAGLVLEAPFTSAADVAATVVPVVGPLLVRSFDSAAKISRIRTRLLVMQGDRDEVIPNRLGKALFDLAPEPKEFRVIHDAGHNDIVETAGVLYREALERFYASCSKQK
jgi:fermentation-respiration switch protein FrsA (DUF1100 family)